MKDQALLDSTYVKLKQQIVDGVVRRYYLDGDLLYAKGNRLYVPNGGTPRKNCYVRHIIHSGLVTQVLSV